MKTLHLILKAQWYDMIESGEKKEEYREIKPYWEKRLLNYDAIRKNYREIAVRKLFFGFDACKEYPRGYDEVCFHYGYTSRKMTFRIESIRFGTGKTEWGAEEGKQYFVIKLGERV